MTAPWSVHYTGAGKASRDARERDDGFWSVAAPQLLSSLDASRDGLRASDAADRLARFGPNTLGADTRINVIRLLIRQFASPIVLLLIAAAMLSVLVDDRTDGAIILAIVIVSGLLGFWQEYNASGIVAALVAKVESLVTVYRDGRQASIAADQIVPGDIVMISAGSSIPADCRVLASQDLFVDEAALTGESFPVEKFAGELATMIPLARRTNTLFMGTHAVSGTARAVVVRTGLATELGRMASRLRVPAAETEFEHGVRRFGYFLVEVTLLFVTAIFAFNVYLDRPVLDSFLFALALAVGLTPQLLPAIVSVNLASGAKAMAARKVVVKRLSAIENLGSMDVLCSDKTGTLTDGQVRLESALDVGGHQSEGVLFHAYLNAICQTGYANPIDKAISSQCAVDTTGWTRLDEIPYDFIRRRLSVLASNGDRRLMISKGSVKAVLDICHVDTPAEDIRKLQAKLEGEGFRTLAVAVREMPAGTLVITRDDEQGMTLLGLLVLRDPPKAGAGDAVASLARLGVSLKMITGDSAAIAEHVAREVGITAPIVLTGEVIQGISDEALPVQADEANVFAEIEPGQKERIIRALRNRGHVVGYMGDGINDAPALHAADASISVQQGADVAREAADIVLLEQDLGVLALGVREGRRTFANTLKYVFMATSANFGNMFSMAGASLFLPFLPLLPKQILLMNLLTDVPELTISTDRVDADWIERPRRWNLRFIRNFMIVFGVLSSVFDYVTFATLLWWLHAPATAFRTGWFVESVISAALIVLAMRTRRAFLNSLPGLPLAAATVMVTGAALALPFTPLAPLFGFTPIPARFLGAMSLIVCGYLMAAETAKRWFYRSKLAATVH